MCEKKNKKSKKEETEKKNRGKQLLSCRRVHMCKKKILTINLIRYDVFYQKNKRKYVNNNIRIV